MARKVEEWVGKDDDTPIPDHVKLRIWDREEGRCYLTGKKLQAGEYDFEHVIALSLWTGEGHGNRESNIRVAWREKHREKTAADRKAKAKSDAARKKHVGIRKAPTMRSAPFPKAPRQGKATRRITPKFEGDILADRRPQP